jgi:hypothetical protein
MSIQAINQLLYRPVSQSKKYDKYFPKVSCQSTFLKETTTTGGLELINEWSKKYAYQTEKISKELKGETLPETINNIYNWLYNYLQYDADGYEQKLKSPACSYHMRFDGIDCKSYSLFASSILSNLGIAHKLRKVVQPSDPTRWSHVYVVVPYKNQELIIDATKSINTEVTKLKEFDMDVKDVSLPYYGMNAGTELPTKSIDNAVRNFVVFLSELNKKGVSIVVTNAIKKDVRYFIDRGIEPKISVTNDFFQVNGKRHYYNISSPSGLGFVSFDSITSLVDNIGIGNIIDRGFGQVFDNGFDLSCWGASFPPSIAEPQTAEKVNDIFTKYNLLNVVKSRDLNATKNVVNEVIAQLTFGRNDRKANIDRAKDCTKKGEEVSYKIFNKALEDLYTALNSDFNVQYKTHSRAISFEFRGGSWTRTYSVKDIATIQFKNTVPGSGSGTSNPSPGPVDNSDSTPPQEKSNKGVLAVLGTALTGGFLLFG